MVKCVKGKMALSAFPVETFYTQTKIKVEEKKEKCLKRIEI